MRTLGAMSFLPFLASSAMLLALVSLTLGEFRERRNWRIPAAEQQGSHWGAGVNLGRLFCLWVFRIWAASTLCMAVFFLRAKHVA